jgi:hypothetical protein
MFLFISGGCIIQVDDGSNLDSVPYPKLRVYLDGGKEIQSVGVILTVVLRKNFLNALNIY